MRISKDPKDWILFVAAMTVIIVGGHIANMINAYGRVLLVVAVLIFLYRLRSTETPKE